jgi:hypothetical protein
MTVTNHLEKYLSTFENKSSISGHRSHLNRFFEIIGAQPETYFTSNRNYGEDVIKLWQSMSKGYSSGSRKQRLIVVVVNFLLDNDITIKPSVLKALRTRTKTVDKITDDITPTKQQHPKQGFLPTTLSSSFTSLSKLLISNLIRSI